MMEKLNAKRPELVLGRLSFFTFSETVCRGMRLWDIFESFPISVEKGRQETWESHARVRENCQIPGFISAMPSNLQCLAEKSRCGPEEGRR